MPATEQQPTAVVGSLESGPVEFRPVQPRLAEVAAPRPTGVEGVGEIQQVAYTAACEPTAPCPTCGPVLLPLAPPPLAGGCLICDGGYHLAPAKASGNEIVQLTAGDTVARYRAEDDL